MALDRRAYLSLCLGSFFIMLGSGFFMWSRWDKAAQDPAAVKAAKARDGQSWVFNHALPAGKKWKVRFQAVAGKPGKVEATLEVHTPAPISIPLRFEVAPAGNSSEPR